MSSARYVMIFCLSLAGLSSGAHPGVGIVEDSHGNIFYTDLKQVWKISLDGKKSVVVTNVHTHELFMDEDDNLFGEHVWYNGEAKNTWGYYVWRLSKDGKTEKVIPDSEGFMTNYSFVRDHVGNMYWADRSGACQKVVRLSSNQTRTWIADPCFHNVRWMKAGRGGLVYVVDFQDVMSIDAKGKVATVATDIADKKMTTSNIDNQNSVFGVWDDPQGNIYAAVAKNREVKKFAPDGKETLALKTSFPWSPSGGLVNSKGELWVLEFSVTNSVRVEKVSRTGARTAY